MEIEINTYKVEEELQKLMMTNPDVKKAVRRVITRLLSRVRSSTSRDIRGVLPSDPRKASQAVKAAAYKRILGGSVSILDKKKASNTRVRLVRSRKIDSNPHQRGGNRMKRSARTEQMDSFYGSDRAFILRWLDSGADRTSPGSQRRRGNRTPGNRGTIAPRNFFESLAQGNLDKLSENLDELIYDELKKFIKLD